MSKVVFRPRLTWTTLADINRAVSKVVSRLRPTWTLRSGNPTYELLCEFRLHCHLLGNLSIRSPPFWQQWFQISRKSKHSIVSIIVEYGDQPSICLWKITNSLAILRLRNPLKPSTRLAGHGIWTRDLPNASLVRYHGATSLGLYYLSELQRILLRWFTFKGISCKQKCCLFF